MSTYTDEELVAFVDGELEAEGTKAIAAAAATDKELARRIAIFSRSREILVTAFDLAKLGPISDRLLAPMQTAGRTSSSGRRSRWWLPLALAASVASLSVGITLSLRLPARHSDLLAFAPDPAEVSQALERNASGVPLVSNASGGRLEIVPLSTLRLSDGTWCREFDAAGREAGNLRRVSGVACRAKGGWAVRGYMDNAQPDTSGSDEAYRLAGGSRSDFTSILGPYERQGSTAEANLIASRWGKR